MQWEGTIKNAPFRKYKGLLS